MVRLRSNRINCEPQVVSCDSACDVGRQGCDGIDRFRGGSVFQDYAEFREVHCELGEVFKKVLFSIEDRDVLHRVGRNFSVKVEN